jgi:hypothetical protein
MLVLAARGLSNRQIALELGANAHVVGGVRKEYGQRGSEDRPCAGRPRSSRDEQGIQRVVETVCQAPAKGLSRWSARTLARHLEIPSATVNRILRENQLQPHRLRIFSFSPDPQFGEKLLEVVALYMKPPDNAVVYEKTSIQAFDRTQPMLPLRAAKPRSWTNEYVRHGTRTLLASLDVATGRVIAHVSAIGQTRPAIIEIKGLKTGHFKESKTAPRDPGEIGSMAHVQCPQSESANNDLQPGQSRMVAATDCEGAGAQSRDSGPVLAVGKTGHSDHRR